MAPPYQKQRLSKGRWGKLSPLRNKGRQGAALPQPSPLDAIRPDFENTYLWSLNPLKNGSLMKVN